MQFHYTKKKLIIMAIASIILLCVFTAGLYFTFVNPIRVFG